VEATPVGELLGRIDGDPYRVASDMRVSDVRITQLLAIAFASVVTAMVARWPAGLRVLLLAVALARGYAGRFT
jgi:hypothetical protein